VPFGNDGDFSHRAMVMRMNGDLANDLGNLAQRSLSMINKNCGAAVPEKGPLTEADEKLLGQAQGLLTRWREAIETQSFNRGLEAIWFVVGEANRYVDEQAPWALKKTDPARMATVLWVLAETVRYLAILVQPVMPESAGKLLVQLAVPEGARDFAHLTGDNALKSGTPLPVPVGVFPRFVDPQAPAEAASAKAKGKNA
jgi:methionyl-tRNA synthetase